jgi:hypothetical protein
MVFMPLLLVLFADWWVMMMGGEVEEEYDEKGTFQFSTLICAEASPDVIPR